ncbi:HEAT repeat domain-containing protein [Candidatus Uabimicrobium amorphum]|uniref:HEAT repeat domain-containing protein n=1 Tax=Uabimicrobium amorphum TaxID=2596890 RepID=A0A5S9IIC3_UABAM|nr:HEAT repeat domain-containing protein [Candidatus Uabimicrobium amorphum]BBM82343.1 hypothetical protein UABAM_00686 [Candidatus Uabimicrobium amorphum]
MRFLLFLCTLTLVMADGSGLKSRNVEVRARAIASIGSLHTKENFIILYQHYQKMNTIEKIAYMKVLGRWRGEQRDKAMGIIGNTLLSRRESRQVKIEATNSLAVMARDDDSTEDTKAQKRVKKIVNVLKKGLRSTRDSYQVRESIVQAFATIGNADHIKAVSAALTDKYQSVRIRAIQTFQALNATDHVKLLIKGCAREKYAGVQREYVEAIYKLDREKGFPLFIKILNNRKNDNALRIRLIEIVASYSAVEYDALHGKAVKALVKAYPNETDMSTKRAVIRALGNFDISQASIRRIYEMTQRERDELKELGKEYLDY